MSPIVHHCVGMFRPGFFRDATESTSSIPGSKPMKLDPNDFKILPGSSWDSWSPEQIRAAKAERHRRQLAGTKAFAERCAAAAAAPGAYRLDEPEPGATSNDVRVYTKLKNGQYKYWGIRDDDMSIEDFWAKFDPENTRDQDDNEDNPPDQASAQYVSSPKTTPPRTSATSIQERTRKKNQKSGQINPQHRVRKSPTTTPQANKRTRKSLATKVSAGLDSLVPDMPESALKSRRSAAHFETAERSDANAKGPRRSNAATTTPAQAPNKSKGRGRPRKAQHGVLDPTRPNADPVPPSAAKRMRGRPPQTKTNSNSPAKQDRPAVEKNAKITKPKQRMQRPSAPSIHAMRTRAKGPVNHSDFLH